ncbi:hypothetical protein ncot_17190 [Nocardioides sp. JQ2195]|uniref:hypothetical protein n=1 Tax=Nocardioides sp. JQ2195 TaxID=2592334 RepID=UPI00143E7C46|nr:hypothetical protein [Nocardioides sp. JQ2195]QIX28131.1 hypothetical protein ncot_17190 [Nocardioides sp. JQ2195]
MMPDDWDPVAAFTRGDRLRSESLKANLTAIRDQTEDPAVRRLVDDLFAGRMGLREVIRDPAFEAELDKGMQRFSEAWEQLTPEQRADLARQGQAEEARRREELGLPERVEPIPSAGDSPLLREDD